MISNVLMVMTMTSQHCIDTVFFIYDQYIQNICYHHVTSENISMMLCIYRYIIVYMYTHSVHAHTYIFVFHVFFTLDRQMKEKHGKHLRT